MLRLTGWTSQVHTTKYELVFEIVPFIEECVLEIDRKLRSFVLSSDIGD